jgi:hypothetical protein
MLRSIPPEGPELAGQLARALGVTAYEARGRLTTAGPAVVASVPDAGPALELVAALRREGFDAGALDGDEALRSEAWFVVRELRMDDHALHLRSRQNESLEIPWTAVTLSLRGVQIASETSTTTHSERKLSAAKALMTSGLAITKTTKKTVSTTAESRQLFLHLRARGLPTAVFLERETDYRGLGPQSQPSRAAAFAELVARVRSRSPDAAVDDRLLNRIAQQQLLGPGPRVAELTRLASALIAAAR